MMALSPQKKHPTDRLLGPPRGVLSSPPWPSSLGPSRSSSLQCFSARRSVAKLPLLPRFLVQIFHGVNMEEDDAMKLWEVFNQQEKKVWIMEE